MQRGTEIAMNMAAPSWTFGVVAVAVIVFEIVALWKVFVQADGPGRRTIIPIPGFGGAPYVGPAGGFGQGPSDPGYPSPIGASA